MIIHRPQELALLIKSHRKKQKLNQQDIGHLTGLKQSTISAFEKKPQATKLDTLFRILSATNLKIIIRSKNNLSQNKNTQNKWSEEW
ncbi:MAG: hypothetical protein A2298_04185 [Gammaproteobacteria bacterium RIFOXYB2_FULL_38_6]|nr:MAG: hypothetical protein A2298_04185 [Gammaproteobacteria bacterium RIFOXYB2_FULL_38_6]